jgi:16S rRNA (guanine527-N7)-methyltransferase
MIAAPTQLDQDELADLLERGIAEMGLAVAEDSRTKLIEYLRLLEKWNQVYNLTAIRELRRAVSVHLLDSLALLPFVTPGRLLDVGSGAGLPGIPLAVARPELSVTLLDSSHKKAAFLNQAVSELGLKNAKVVCQRVETWQPEERFDYIVSRAFSEIAEFVASSHHLLAPKGVLGAMKGILPFEEIERLPPEFRLRQLQPLSIPFLEASRHLVLMERV